MTNENDRKDENQLRIGFCMVAATLSWPLASFVSAAIMILSAPITNLGPIVIFVGFIYYAIPAAVIGAILGIFFGAPRLANWALLVILCLGIMTYGWFILMN